MTIFLTTNRLLLKTPSLSDFDDLYILQTDPEVMHYIYGNVRTREQVKKELEAAIQHQEKHGFSLCSVIEKDSGKFIGRAGLIYHRFNDNQPDIELAYALHTALWGKGYSTELAKALIAWGSRHLSIPRIIANFDPENERSRKVLERAGMHYWGKVKYSEGDIPRYEIFLNKIDPDKISIIPATFTDYPILQNMGRFYVYDISGYLGHEAGWEIPENGLYECIDFKKYWGTETAYPFLIRCENELAGFAIIDKKGSSADIDFNMAQFFILRKFQNKGLGRFVAFKLFDQFKGTWEAMVLPGNEGSYRATRNAIRAYTQDNYVEYSREIAHFNNRRYNIFKFDSRLRNPSITKHFISAKKQ